jgi:iron-sulfur cluster assembly protein
MLSIVKSILYTIFAVNLDKINIDHDKSFWYCQKKIINLMQDDGFDAATDYVRVGVKSGGCLVCPMI